MRGTYRTVNGGRRGRHEIEGARVIVHTNGIGDGAVPEHYLSIFDKDGGVVVKVRANRLSSAESLIADIAFGVEMAERKSKVQYTRYEGGPWVVAEDVYAVKLPDGTVWRKGVGVSK